MILMAFMVLVNASFSMIQYRKYVQFYQLDQDLVMPIDVKVEIIAGLVLGIVGSIWKFTANLKLIKL